MRKIWTFLSLLSVVFLSEAWPDTYSWIDFTCPIDGTQFESKKMMSSYQSGMRLDLKPLGAISAPVPIPVCPTDGFVLSDYKPEEIERLRPFVMSKEYQDLTDKTPPYFRLARIREFLAHKPEAIGLAYLQASWEVENHDPVAHDEYLKKSLQFFEKSLTTPGLVSAETVQTQLLCAELERRLGKFGKAESRIKLLLSTKGLLKGSLEKIAVFQLELISEKDKKPYEIPF
jgi:hypothetical protein